MITLENISKTYNEGGRRHTVLEKINWTIAQGDRIVLLGKSGSGKSTLLNIVSGIDAPSGGTVRYDETDITGLSEHERTLFRRKNMGFVFQFFNLIPTLTVEENLLLPLELNNHRTADSNKHITELLEKVGLADRADSFPDRLSGGEQQRIAIARALIHDPMLVLADEPTGNLDYETGSRVMDLLNTMVVEEGKTLLMATHSRELIKLADRVLTIRQGTLEEQDPENTD
jgi:putative ABC transport system ATP-binding protein